MVKPCRQHLRLSLTLILFTTPHLPRPGPLSGGVASTPVTINFLKALSDVFSVLILAPECLFLEQ